MGRLAVGLVSALVTAPAAIPGAQWTDALAAGVAIVALLGIAARCGLLAMAAVGFFVEPLFPLSSNIGAWYGRPTLALVLVSAAMALYGFFVSLGGRSPFGEGSRGLSLQRPWSAGAPSGPAPERSLRPQAVAHPGLGQQVARPRRVRLQFVSELAHVNAHVVELAGARPPHLAQELAMRQDLAGVLD